MLNVEAPAGGYVTEPAGFAWLPGALEALALLKRAGMRLTVATNQSGVGRGLMTAAALAAVHARMAAQAAAHGAVLDAVLVCPHAPQDGCACRKPAPGLILEALRLARIGPEATLLVGDDARDLEAARRAGVAAALVRTGKGLRAQAQARAAGVPVYDDLGALARALLAPGTLHPGDGAPADARECAMDIEKTFTDHAAVMARAAAVLPPVLGRIVAAMHGCLAGGGRILACGNGGSAADAQHLVAELVGRFEGERRALAAIALVGDPATLTALGNDYGYERVFARQVEALAHPGDLLFAISTSGNSANVVQAAACARARGCTVVAMTGEGGGRLKAEADLLLEAPSRVVARIQEVHALCLHALCAALDARLRGDAPT